MPDWVRKLVEHGATVIITALGMAIVSCANTSDLGAIAGGLLGGSSIGESSSTENVEDIKEVILDLEYVTEQLQCVSERTYQDIINERNAWKATAGEKATEGELKDLKIEALEDFLETAEGERDAAVERLNGILALASKAAEPEGETK